MQNKKKFLILGGCPRSGTTILNILLNSSPLLWLANEHDVSKSIRISEEFFVREDRLKARGERVLSCREKKMEVHREEQWAATVTRDKSQRRVIETLLASSLLNESEGELRDNELWLGDKFPTYYQRDLGRLVKVFPDVHIIHITRSVRHCMNSNMFRSKMSKEGNDWFQVRSLKWHLQEWIDAWNSVDRIRHMGIPVLHLKYEDLITDVEGQAQVVCDFLDIDNHFDISLVKSPSQGLESLSDQELSFIEHAIPRDLLDWEQSVDTLNRSYPSIANVMDRNVTSGSKFLRRVRCRILSFIRNMCRLRTV